MSRPNSEQADYWEDRAPSWLDAEGHIARVSSRFGQQAIDRLDLAPGQRVLDIGCGSGPTSLALAERVGPDGEIVGADIAPAMLTAARARAADAGARNVRFVQADMQVDDLGAGMFDAAFSQFGVMFFNDPVVAFTNIRRTIHPGGPLAFACWQPIFSNEWMLVPGSAVVEVTGALPSMPGPGEPGPFSLSEPGRIEEVLDGAGFTHVDVVAHDEVLALAGEEIDSLVKLSQAVGPVRQALKDAGDDEDLRRRLIEAVDAAVLARVVDGEARFNAGAFIVSARA
jgi:SAM-dependent methyltransferase